MNDEEMERKILEQFPEGTTLEEISEKLHAYIDTHVAKFLLQILDHSDKSLIRLFPSGTQIAATVAAALTVGFYTLHECPEHSKNLAMDLCNKALKARGIPEPFQIEKRKGK